MRTLKYAILGLLSREPLTGYDIARMFGEGLGSFWSAKHSQIYPELKRLTDEGLVHFQTIIHGERLEKKLYTITPAGKADFAQWMHIHEPLEPTPKDVFKLKTYYCDALSPSEMAEHFQDQLTKRLAKVEYLQGIMDKSYTGKTIRDLSGPPLGDYLVLKAAIMRETTYVHWLEQCMDELALR